MACINAVSQKCRAPVGKTPPKTQAPPKVQVLGVDMTSRAGLLTRLDLSECVQHRAYLYGEFHAVLSIAVVPVVELSGLEAVGLGYTGLPK